MTPKDYAAAHRAERLRRELPRGQSVTAAIYDAGFNSSGRFYADSNERLGMTPKRFRAGGDGTTIRFAVGECSLGSILVAATDKGVCAISLGDTPETLLRDLQDRFPKANLVGGDRDFERLVAKVVGLIEAPALGCDLPLDVQGTAFQERVWQALREIPAGSTASYAEVAKRIGSPGSVRAVAPAGASNRLAVAIPVPSRGADRRRALGLSLGRRATAGFARERSAVGCGRSCACETAATRPSQGEEIGGWH